MKFQFPNSRQSAFAVIAAFTMLFSQAVSAQQDKLPEAKEVLKKYIKATGGEEKYKSIKTMKTKAEMEFVGQGFNAKMTMISKAPNMIKATMELGAIGSQTRGNDGKTCYESSTITGARIIKGSEAERMSEEADFAALLQPEKIYKEMKVAAKEKVGDEECFRLEFVRKDGTKETSWYSVESGLSIKSIQTVPSPMGNIRVTSESTDYKEVGGIKVPHTVTQKMGPVTVKMKIKSVEVNPELDDSEFAAPEDVKALIK